MEYINSWWVSWLYTSYSHAAALHCNWISVISGVLSLPWNIVDACQISCKEVHTNNIYLDCISAKRLQSWYWYAWYILKHIKTHHNYHVKFECSWISLSKCCKCFNFNSLNMHNTGGFNITGFCGSFDNYRSN